MPTETVEVTFSSSSRRMENSTENILKSLEHFGGKHKHSYNSKPLQDNEPYGNYFLHY